MVSMETGGCPLQKSGGAHRMACTSKAWSLTIGILEASYIEWFPWKPADLRTLGILVSATNTNYV